MRVWIDITNSPHVPFFRPLVALLLRRGHDVEVTTRAYAQTVDLLELSGIPHTIVGPAHGGAKTREKVRAMAGRLTALRRYARGREFDIALTHASHELALAARSLRIPSAYAFDYEFARAQHGLGCRAARRVVVPDAIPDDRLRALGATARKLVRYPGLKEEYYLAHFEPDETVPGSLGLDPARLQVVVRTPPEVSLYHRHGNPLFEDVLTRLGADPGVQAVVLCRTDAQRESIAARSLASLVLPDRAIDAQSLIAASDLVVSAGGTMNREAVALGVPVYTTFAGQLGAVDEGLIAAGRLRQLVAVDQIELVKRDPTTTRVRRDPGLMLDMLLSALEP
jgi:predicted glycosyltransferase